MFNDYTECKMSYRKDINMFDPAFFFKEVSKEVIHQVTGHDFDEEEEKQKSVFQETNEAYSEAISSAYDQQEALEQELENDSMFWSTGDSDSDSDDDDGGFFDID